jgi:hypothetical protein
MAWFWDAYLPERDKRSEITASPLRASLDQLAGLPEAFVIVMKIVVIGGSGLVGSKLVTKLREQGHEPVAAPPASGVNTLTGEGLAAALDGASVVVDVSNSPFVRGRRGAGVLRDIDPQPPRRRNDRRRRASRGVVGVGTERLSDSGYFRAKIAQEKLDWELLDPLLDRPRDPVLRVRRPHRRRHHRRQHGAPGARAHPAPWPPTTSPARWPTSLSVRR